MTQAEAEQMLLNATSLVATLSSLIPQLVVNLQSIRDGLATHDDAVLTERIAGVHAQVQALDGSLQALRS